MMTYIASDELRTKDFFHHIDMGFINHRVVLSALGAEGRRIFEENRSKGTGHLDILSDNHLLVTLLLDMCDTVGAPSLDEALRESASSNLFRSTETLAPCDSVYTEDRVEQEVTLDIDYGLPVYLEYHTSHICSDTGKMMLADGGSEDYRESIIGVLHKRKDRYSIEPLVMGSPWYDHPRNEGNRTSLMWEGLGIGEILPQDIDQFSELTSVEVKSADEWMTVMKQVSEEFVKECFARLLNEPTKKDWGGESNDHFSSSVTLGGRRKTAAFLLKGPSSFREMTLEMCGKRADQIHRLANSYADISIVQHAHLIGEVVRLNLRRMVVYPGASHRKFCVIDGQETYRILKAYGYV